VVNEDAVGTNLMLKAELHRVKVQLAALHGQPPALDAALATSLAFDDQPNTAAAQAAQVSPQNSLHLFHQIYLNAPIHEERLAHLHRL